VLRWAKKRFRWQDHSATATVVPAKAGPHFALAPIAGSRSKFKIKMGPGFRRDDGERP